MEILLHHASAESQPFRGVVIAADRQNFQILPVITPPGQAEQKIVKYLYRLGAGDRFVVYVPGNQNRVRLFRVHNAENFPQNVRLIVQHTELVQPLAQMQIRQMNQFHKQTPPFVMDDSKKGEIMQGKITKISRLP